MRKPHLLTIGFLFISLVVTSALAANAQTRGTREISTFSPLRNQDVITMVDGKYPSDAIVTIIKLSACNFDTFPPVLQGLKRRGVPSAVLEAMIDAPYGPPANSKVTATGPAIYHYAEILKQKGFVTGSAVRREDGGGFSADRRAPGGILRREQ